MKKEKIFVVVGSLGVGKTAIKKALLDDKSLNLSLSVSATSRPKRPYETDGKDYFFLSQDEFRKKIDNNEFIEWLIEKQNDEYYGTLKSEITRISNEGKLMYLEIEYIGLVNLLKEDKFDIVSIFIDVPSIEELNKRMLNRNYNESAEEIQKRIDMYSEYKAYEKYCDYTVINDNLETAIEEVKQIVKKNF